MKAKTFLERIKEIRSDDYLTKNQFGKMADRAIDKAIDFYSQPFKPELIMELFKGVSIEDEHYYIGLYGFVFPVPPHIGLAHKIKKGKDPLQIPNFFYIETLNDFISDCKRAGIDLEFKPEIVKEYFS